MIKDKRTQLWLAQRTMIQETSISLNLVKETKLSKFTSKTQETIKQKLQTIEIKI